MRYARVTVRGVRQYLHRAIVERVLGRSLKGSECIHHMDGNRLNNNNNNLVVCPNGAYHKLLHKRTQAYDACGNVNKRKCYLCQKYDEITNMTFIERSKDSFHYHRECARLNYHENKKQILDNRRDRRAHGKSN